MRIVQILGALLIGALLVAGCESGEVADAPVVEPQGSVDSVPSNVVFERGTGGSNHTELGFGIVLNEDSELEREWVVAQDTTLPVRLVELAGVRTVFESGQFSGDFQYAADVDLEASEPLSAVEVRFVVFDVWGDFIRTLNLTRIEEIPAGEVVSFSPRWNLFSENEARDYYASLGYVARVRTADGQVLQAQEDPIAEEAARFSESFTVDQLDPESTSPPDSVDSATDANGV